MVNVGELTADVAFDEGFDPNSLVWNAELGFMEIPAENVALRSLRLVGFGAPVSCGGYDYGREVTPLTRFADLPPEFQTIAKQGKGVGPRMYNIGEALGGLDPEPVNLGVYTFDIDPNKIHDLRAVQGSSSQRILRHAKRILDSRLRSVEAVANDIDTSYGDAQTVLLEVPPLPKLRRQTHGVPRPEGVTPQFMIIRDSTVLLRRIGSTSVAW